MLAVYSLYNYLQNSIIYIIWYTFDGCWLFLNIVNIALYLFIFFKVEVYQSDFNAEREARERIAGEKADLLEELNKLRKSSGIPIIISGFMNI